MTGFWPWKFAEHVNVSTACKRVWLCSLAGYISSCICFLLIFSLLNWTALSAHLWHTKDRGLNPSVFSPHRISQTTHTSMSQPGPASGGFCMFVCLDLCVDDPQNVSFTVYLCMLLKPQPSWPVIMSALGDIPARRDSCCGQSGSNLNPVHCKHSRRAQDISLFVYSLMPSILS